MKNRTALALVLILTPLLGGLALRAGEEARPWITAETNEGILVLVPDRSELPLGWSWPEEDEPGWDCRYHGNRRCR